MTGADFENLHFSSDEDEDENGTQDLFASPSATPTKSKPRTPMPQEQKREEEPRPRMPESKYDTEQAREDALRRELEGVRNINQVMEGVISSLESAKGNMATVSRTVTSASTLLSTWTKILSQTEHNQRLLLNPDWQGATQDVADIETEAELKAQAAARRAVEEERRREAAKRRGEDEEREREAAHSAVRGARGRGRGGLSRSGSKYGIHAGYAPVGGQQRGVGRGSNTTTTTTTTTRGGGVGGNSSGVGRGVGSTRGRGTRGVR